MKNYEEDLKEENRRQIIRKNYNLGRYEFKERNFTTDSIVVRVKKTKKFIISFEL